MKILHDWDGLFTGTRFYAKRSIESLAYALARDYPNDWKEKAEGILQERLRFVIACAKLENMLGISAHYGLRKEILSEYPDLKEQLEKLGHVVHLHKHYENLKIEGTDHFLVTWTPKLDPQPPIEDKKFRRFDSEWDIDDPIPEMSWYIFHLDYFPQMFSKYIEFLWRIKN